MVKKSERAKQERGKIKKGSNRVEDTQSTTTEYHTTPGSATGQIATPISMPKAGPVGEEGMIVTACRGEGGMRNRLILPLLPLGVSSEGLMLVEESLALRLYIIPVPILDLRLACETPVIENPVAGIEGVDRELA